MLLSERVRKKELLGFVTIGKDVAAADEGPEAGISYYTETPTFLELPDWLQRVINEEVQRLRFEKANVDQALVRKLTKGTIFRRLGLAKVSATGEVIRAKEENKIATFAIPAIALFLMFLLVMTAPRRC